MQSKRKGIVLAGGTGSRLWPVTLGVSKQLVPVYNKPLVYYPLSTLMLSGIQDILIITTLEDQASFIRLLGDGSEFGVNLSYAVQDSPNGIAEAFLIGRSFIDNSACTLALGDNVFYGHGLTETLENVATAEGVGATVFGQRVAEPERFGVVEFDDEFRVLSLEEKPESPKSDYAVTGLYSFDSQVVDIAESIKASPRGELEIISVLQKYFENSELQVELLGRGYTWFDTGTYASLLSAAQFVETIETRQGYKIGCLEEIGFYQGWITESKLRERGEKMQNNDYGQYLLNLI